MKTDIDFDEIVERKGTYCTQWDYVADRFGQTDLLPFTVSDTDFAVPNEIIDGLQQRIAHPVFGYTRWNHSDFKDSILNWYQDRFQYKPQADWIVYSPSVIYSISKLIELNSEIGDHVLIQTPSYDAFFKTITANQRNILENELRYENNQYLIDFNDLEEKLSLATCKILLLCSPHNPTGRVWTTEELTKIIQLCETYQVFLISDEIHMDILREGQHHLPILKQSAKPNNIALCTSASKTFNTPGLIASYLFIPDEQLRNRFLAVLKERDGLSSTSILGMLSTISAYNHCGEWLNQLTLYLDQNIHYTKEYLTDQLPALHVVDAEATYLLWIDCRKLGIPMSTLQDALIHHGKVAIMAGETYGQAGKPFLRLNVGCSRKKLIDGLHRLKQSIDYLQQKNDSSNG